MSDLYRLRCDSCTHESGHQDQPDPIVESKCHDWHPDLVWYEPVEPCEHGKYDKHEYQGNIEGGWHTMWCLGARLGGTT